MGKRLTAHPRKGARRTGVQVCAAYPHTHHPYAVWGWAVQGQAAKGRVNGVGTLTRHLRSL